MLVSTERLYYEAESTGFRPEILEKVIYLIHLLNRFSKDPFLKDRFVLKGGTALNLFPFREHEKQFLHELLENGKIDASLLTMDKSLEKRIHSNPALLWKAENVKQYKNKK